MEEILGDTSNKPMLDLGRQCYSRFYVREAPYLEDPHGFRFYVQVIKDRLDPNRKALYLGEPSKLPGYLRELEREALKTADASDYPAIAALGYAISYLNSHKPVTARVLKTKNLGKTYAVKSLYK